MGDAVLMTFGGAAVVVAYTLFAVLLALVVVVAAAWAQLDRRRGDDDRTGRALAVVMRRLETTGARGRSLAAAGTERARARLVRSSSGERLRAGVAGGLDAVARGATSLSGRLAAQRAAGASTGTQLPAPTTSTEAPTASAAVPGQPRRRTGRLRSQDPSTQDPPADDPPAGGAHPVADEVVAGGQVEDDRNRLPTALRDRLVS